MSSFTQERMKKRAIKRLAEIFHDHWEEGRTGSTRIFEHVLPDAWLIVGKSLNGGTYREHIVPCMMIRDQSIKMYSEGYSVENVADMINKHLAIVLITEAEREKLDNELGLKTAMPRNWVFSSGDPFQRLIDAGVEFA